MASSLHHYDMPWCIVGKIVIMYHANLTVNTAVQYDERTVFGASGAYAVWTGTAPRNYSLSANLVAANQKEIDFNLNQVRAAHNWTQEHPPQCASLVSPITTQLGGDVEVRIESYDSGVDEGVHLDNLKPIQISLSLSLKECKSI